MSKYILTRETVQDLSQIWNYTFDEWSEAQADRYYQMLLDNCADLATFPNFGKDYSKIYPSLFGFLVLKHVIFYRVLTKNQIEITRILHERMDVEDHLKSTSIE